MAESPKVEIFMPLYVGDYDRDTADLSFEEHGFYGAILRALWTRGGYLKHPASSASSTAQADEKQKLARILRTDVATFDRLWVTVSRFFVHREDGSFYQKRLLHELEKAKSNKQFAVERARKGGIARAQSAASSKPEAELEVAPQAQLEEQLQASTSPSGSLLSSPLSNPERAHVSDSDVLWSGWKWLEKFGHAWARAKGELTYGRGGDRDSRAAGELREILESLPADQRLAAQQAAPAMFAAFLSEGGKNAAAGHLFSWFVNGFNGLRASCRPAVAERRPEKVMPLKAEPRPPRMAGAVR